MTIWLSPLLATVLLQIMSAFLTRALPTLAPILTMQAGVSATAVGHYSALNTIGSVLFLIMGAPLIRRLGPVRTLQLGVACSGIGVLLLAAPTPLGLALASLLIGVGYGPSPPAGSEILQRHAPRRHRALIFSVKQAGVPVGGVLAGLLLPAFADESWRHGLLASAALAMLSILAVQPVRSAVDRERDPAQDLSWAAFLSWSNLSAPLRALMVSRALPPLTAAAFCFALGQGVLFAFFVTYAVTELQMSLVSAGAVFAVMQATGVPGRILLGFVADRAGSAVSTLAALSLASAATLGALALSTPAWPVSSIVLVAGVSGVTVASWNGIYLAEVARLAPPREIGHATAGSTLLTFVGYVLGPVGFALLVEQTGSYRASFAAVAALLLLALLFLGPLLRPGAPAP
jgi:MFS family permease